MLKHVEIIIHNSYIECDKYYVNDSCESYPNKPKGTVRITSMINSD